MKPASLNPQKLQVYPVAERESLSTVENILIEPDSQPPEIAPPMLKQVEACAVRIKAARQRGAGVLLVYGAHLLRNGASLMLGQMMARGWVTHLATNGAGTIHDWEYSWLGRSLEGVEKNVAQGTFGTWDETSRNIHLALLAGGLIGEGYGAALGRFICEDGTTLPTPEELEALLRTSPDHPLAAARADLLHTMRTQRWQGGRIHVTHRWKRASILAQAFQYDIGLTVHPGIGYDIISNHPMFNGAVIGRAATWDFHAIGGAIDTLDHGVVLSIGSATMGPQVFEKSLSCVHNIRKQEGRAQLQGHTIYVVDLQDGGNWDWSQGEPPKNHPVYYLRFCKSFSRMGGEMRYLQCDNLAFVHNLYHRLSRA